MTPEDLVQQHLGWAEGIARNLHRTMRLFDVNDLIQEASIGLLTAARLYDPAKNDNFRGFAYLYVVNAPRQIMRRRHFRNQVMGELDSNEVTTVIRQQSEQRAIDSHEVQREMWRARRRRDLLRAKFHRLTPQQAQIAQLVFIEEFSIPETCGLLEVSEPALKADLRVIADKLKGKAKRTNPTEAALLRAICELRGRVVTHQQLGQIVGKERSVVAKAIRSLKQRGEITAKAIKKGTKVIGNLYAEKRLDRSLHTSKQFRERKCFGD